MEDSAVRHTGSIDDVGGQTTPDYYVYWYEDPNERDCTISQTLLNVKLQHGSVQLYNFWQYLDSRR